MLTLPEKYASIQRDAELSRKGVRRWRRLVRIAYFDEAGVAKEKQEPFLVVGGILIHGDTEWQPIEMCFNAILESGIPPEIREGFCFHAMHLHGNHRSFKGLLSPEQRFALLRDLVTTIKMFKLPISYGAVTREKLRESLPGWKSEHRTHLAHQMAFTLCAMGFQGWFNRGPFSDEVAICVADKNDAKNRQLHLKQDFAKLRNEGVPEAPFGVYYNFVDALHFAALSESIGLQLADTIAFLIKRHLMGKEDTEELYQELHPLLVCEPDSALWPIPPAIS